MLLQNKYQLCVPLLSTAGRLWILKYNVPHNGTIVYTKYRLRILFKCYKLISPAQSAAAIITTDSSNLFIKKNGYIYFVKIKT